jgi:predicted DNA-binding transcriptional regulator AlpA
MYLRKDEVCSLVAADYSTVWRWMREGKFPSPRVINATNGKQGTLRWIASEVEEWMQSQPKRDYRKTPANSQLNTDAKLSTFDLK